MPAAVTITTFASAMNMTPTEAQNQLMELGFYPHELELAELVLVAEMAWADGEVQPIERYLLERYCDELVELANLRRPDAPLTRQRARRQLNRLLRRPLSAAQRRRALDALRVLWSSAPHGSAARYRALEQATQVADAAGEPRWHRAEERWQARLLMALNEGER
ncbi:MAG: hypothetical protein JNK82_28195 [Myxococcaceae bacterium]|nr:hypothetical protein [Myxococcaceae bacterium]